MIRPRGRIGIFAITLAAALSLSTGAALAHQAVNLDDRDSTPARGPLLVDGTVSFAVNASVARGDRRGFRFDLDEGDTLAVQLLIRDEAPGNELRASKLPRVTITDPSGRKTRMIIDERTEFYEPYGGNTYFYLSRVEDEAIPGRYRVRVSGRSERAVQAVVAVGYREVPGEVRTRSSNVDLSVLHGLTDNSDVEAVDVYADSTLVAQGITTGQLVTSKLKAGNYDITVVPEGSSRFTREPLLRDQRVSLRAGDNYTFAMHHSSTGDVTSTLFENETRTVGRDMGRLTFRHIAQAPKVDLRTRGSILMDGLRNGDELDRGLRSGDYKLRVVREGTRRKLVPTTTHTLQNAPGRQDMGDNRIVYLWGSEDFLRVKVQEIPLDLR